ncbi:MAG TPA: cell division protein FtsQ [Opitutaceae bacterium]|nr:cell division protein FtsQ [Opitutaceae bacterium]
MPPPASIPPSARSWKDIRQGVSKRAMPREGRRRMWLASAKFALGCAVVVGCGVAFLAVYQVWQSDPARLKEPVKAAPLQRVAFSTDGVLDRAWVDQTLALPRNASLMGLDLAALERRLLASGQVHSVVLRRRFADNALVVSAQERTPVARLMGQAGGDTPRELLVARDGVAFAGSGYDPAALARLPWLDGIELKRTADRGFEPIPGMEPVAQLLAAAGALVPELAGGWQVVSLARYTSDEEIIVHSRDVPEIVFDAQVSFPHQLAKLAYIVESLHTHGDPPLARVDLAVGNQVPVELREAVSLQPTRPTLFPSAPQPRPRRDF